MIKILIYDAIILALAWGVLAAIATLIEVI